MGCKKKTIVQENQKVSDYDYDNLVIENNLKFINNSFGGKTVTSIDNKNESGQFAKYKDGETSPFKIGVWKKYYSNGQLKEEGKYLIGRYLQCCLVGYCFMYYNYKVGNWKYFYPDGTLELDGNYSIKKMWIRTSCGGDYIKYGILDEDTKFYDKVGRRISKNKKINYEKGDLYIYRGTYLTPLTDNDTIISVGHNK